MYIGSWMERGRGEMVSVGEDEMKEVVKICLCFSICMLCYVFM